MREGSLCSIILHGAIVAALVWSFTDDGGAPETGGGAQAIEIVMVPSTAGTNAEETVETEAEVAEEEQIASAEPRPTPPPPARPITRTPPPPPPPQPQPVEPLLEEIPPLPAPIGPEAIVPPIPAETVPMPDELEALLEPPPPEPMEPVELPEELEALLEPPPPEPLEEIEPVDLPEDLEALLEPPPPEPQPDEMVPPEKPDRSVKLPEVKEAVTKKKEPVEKPKAAEPQVVGTEDQQLATAAPTPAQPGANDATAAPSGANSAGLAPGQLESYAGLLQAWLEKHKRYPDAARRRKHEGIVTVEFTIDAQGNVLRHRIVNDSGYQLLDREAEDLLARASPVPPPPDGKGRTFVVPINFEIR